MRWELERLEDGVPISHSAVTAYSTVNYYFSLEPLAIIKYIYQHEFTAAFGCCVHQVYPAYTLTFIDITDNLLAYSACTT